MADRKWLEDKKKFDDTDGLWRIHDNLYDVSSFINKHPGGQFWLEETRGLDITESFESHHVNSDAVRLILDKFFVKKATKPRTSAYTFDKNGFFKTLQRKANDVLKTLPKKSYRTSQFYSDALLVAMLAFSCMSIKYPIFAILASISSSCLIIASHNFCHQRDNLRMYYGEILLASVKEVRIIHVLSHHAFPNTRKDFQVTLALPIFNPFPEKKSFFVKYLSWIFSTVVIYPFGLFISGLPNIIECFVERKNYQTAFLPLVLPASMYVFGGGSILMTIATWQAILMLTGTIFLIIANTTSHLHPGLYMEGDARRVKHELDWGIYQLDTIYERDIDNQFVTLVTFGNHALHHLFPTLDNSYLRALYPVLEETLKEFNIKTINVTTYWDLYLGFIKQAGREIPKSIPPFLEKAL